MGKYSVLMTINQYVEVEAESAFQAADVAHEEFREGKHAVNSEYPLFVCDECDLIDEDGNLEIDLDGGLSSYGESHE